MVEVLVGLFIAVCLAAAIAPVSLALQKAGEDETDGMIWFLQARVAIARFEKDMRLASGAGCPFPSVSMVLQASPTQVIILRRTGDESPPIIVEWEIVNGSLMRRWGRCPDVAPTIFPHSLYVDHKTMLEDVSNASRLSYWANGSVFDSVPPDDLAQIEEVTIELRGSVAGRAKDVVVESKARVGR